MAAVKEYMGLDNLHRNSCVIAPAWHFYQVMMFQGCYRLTGVRAAGIRRLYAITYSAERSAPNGRICTR